MKHTKTLLGVFLLTSILEADILKFSYISPDNIVSELAVTPKNIKNCETLEGFKKDVLDESVYKDFIIESNNNLTVKYSTCSYKNQLKVLADAEYKKDKNIEQTSWNIFIKKGSESIGKIQTKPFKRKVFILKYE